LFHREFVCRLDFIFETRFLSLIVPIISPSHDYGVKVFSIKHLRRLELADAAGERLAQVAAAVLLDELEHGQGAVPEAGAKVAPRRERLALAPAAQLAHRQLQDVRLLQLLPLGATRRRRQPLLLQTIPR